MHIKKATEIIQQTSEVLKNWSNFAAETKVAPKLSEAIAATLLPFL